MRNPNKRLRGKIALWVSAGVLIALLFIFGCSDHVPLYRLPGRYRLSTRSYSTELVIRADHTYQEERISRDGSRLSVSGKWEIDPIEDAGGGNKILFHGFLDPYSETDEGTNVKTDGSYHAVIDWFRVCIAINNANDTYMCM
jgi:hypothetical protein